MIFLDSDVLVIALRYKRDSRWQQNQHALDELRLRKLPLAITSHTLLEVIGVLSFNTTPQRVATLPDEIPLLFNLRVVPDPLNYPTYSGCAVVDLVHQMGAKNSLGDAVTIAQIHRFAPQAACLLSWNARHFMGKISIPVLTPLEWWQQHQPTP